jgi:signal recognition particle subunit SEC65
MKNIHLLPTDKPSRFAGTEYITNVQGIDKRALKFKLWGELIPNKDLKDIGYIPQNIYITSDEEIKEGDWYINLLDNKIWKAEPYFINTNGIIGSKLKKIILTTDAQLIKDGVQAIDDTFLEWFVENPSCEEIEVKKETLDISTLVSDYKKYPNLEVIGYKIIIPQEEAKQETLEEVSTKYADNNNPSKDKEDACYWYASWLGFRNGAKYQAERSYSEEDMLKFAWFLIENVGQYSCDRTAHFEGKYLEQFKKKA